MSNISPFYKYIYEISSSDSSTFYPVFQEHQNVRVSSCHTAFNKSYVKYSFLVYFTYTFNTLRTTTILFGTSCFFLFNGILVMMKRIFCLYGKKNNLNKKIQKKSVRYLYLYIDFNLCSFGNFHRIFLMSFKM